MREPLCAVASPSMAGLKKGFPQTLDQAPVILPSALAQHRHELEGFFHENKLVPRIVMESDEPELQSNLAMLGKGISFLPMDAIGTHVKDKRLIVLGEIPVHMELWLVGLKRKIDNAVAETLMKKFDILLHELHPESEAKPFPETSGVQGLQ